MPVVTDESVNPDNSDYSFYFQRTLTLAEYEKLVENAAGATTVDVPSYFLTNTAKNESVVYVRNEYFGVETGQFFNAKSFTDLSFSGNIKEEKDYSVTFNFTMETIAPVTVKLTGLVNASGQSEFTYTPSAAGPQQLSLKTVNDSGTVTVELSSEDYADASLSAVQANNVIIPAGKITFNTNLMYAYDITVYKDENYSDRITTISSIDNGDTNPELNLGSVALTDTVYFYMTDRLGRNYAASATVQSLLNGTTLNFTRVY